MKRRDFLARTTAIAAGLALSNNRPAIAALPGETTARLADGEMTKLAGKVTGGVYRPGDTDYERLRQIYNVKFDRHPAAIAHCTSPDDVRHAVTFAREQSMPLAVRCGGHSYAGHGLCDDGVVIDLSGLRSIEVATDRQSVRVGGGALVGAIDRETARFGRATVLGQCPSVGIGGFALGGGVGPLMSPFGLGCDNLLSADLVLADGRQVTASADHHPDLFWAIRGGGGNFGIATAFTMKLHPVSDILGGDLIFRTDQLVELLAEFQAFAESAPDELTLIAMFVPGEGGKSMLVVQACHVGDADEGERVLAPLRASPLLVVDTVKRKPYLELQSATPADIPPQMHENRGGFLKALDRPVIDILAHAIATAPANYLFAFIHLHGAVTRVAKSATAFPLRSSGMAWSLSGFWNEPGDRHDVVEWAETTVRRLAPFGEGAYVNVMDAEDDRAVRAAYGTNYARLARLKERYDPTNLFALNQNIRPDKRG